jgi:antitoxin (DNA-binding transcriptional repressor) of toxin-antitoxin stability system
MRRVRRRLEGTDLCSRRATRPAADIVPLETRGRGGRAGEQTGWSRSRRRSQAPDGTRWPERGPRERPDSTSCALSSGCRVRRSPSLRPKLSPFRLAGRRFWRWSGGSRYASYRQPFLILFQTEVRMETCPNCGEPAHFEITEVFPELRQVHVQACYEANRAGWIDADFSSLAGVQSRIEILVQEGGAIPLQQQYRRSHAWCGRPQPLSQNSDLELTEHNRGAGPQGTDLVRPVQRCLGRLDGWLSSGSSATRGERKIRG